MTDVMSLAGRSGSSSPRVYTDLNGLQSISQLGRDNTAEGLREVAEQFESIFLNIMLKEMRGSNEHLFKDNYLRSSEMDTYQENFDNQLSMDLSASGGIGLADKLYQQLLGRFNIREAGAAEAPQQNTVPPAVRARLASAYGSES